MKNKMLIKMLSLFVIVTMLQVYGISSKLLNGISIVQVNAETDMYDLKDKHIMSSVEIQGDMLEGQTLTAIVKDSNGNDITKYCDINWNTLDNPTTDYKVMLDNGGGISSPENSKCILGKENIGKYIGIIVWGDYVDPNAPAGSSQVAYKVFSTNKKVEPNPLTHWQKVINTDGDADWYLLNNDNSKITGWKEIGGNWYYFNPKRNGKMDIYWEYINGSWYYFSPDSKDGQGKMLTGWVKYKSWKEKVAKYYYLYSNGSMAMNTTIDGHYVGANGASTDDVNMKSLTKK